MIRLVEPDAAKRRAAREYDAERVDPRPDVEGVPPLLKAHASDPSGRRISDISDQHSPSLLHTRGNDRKRQRRSFRRDLVERMTVFDRR
jgi:hypothetical protein